MTSQFRRVLRTGGSVAVVLLAILLVSADVETAVALVAFCTVGYSAVRFARGSDRSTSLREQVPAPVVRVVAAVAALAAFVAVADGLDAGLWMVGMLVTGYTGYRSEQVGRGALVGMAVGVAGAVLLTMLGLGLLVLVTVFDVGGGRDILFQALFAPTVVGAVGLLYVAFALVLAAVTGLVCGGLGGAIARLL